MDDTDPRVGTILQERYRVLERLASGGMGVVYRGERIGLGRAVAIKFLHGWAAAAPDALKRFEVEAQAMSRLNSPGCVSVIDYGNDGGAPYLVMDFVAGKTLRDLLDEGPIPVRAALALVRQLLAGLSHAHAHAIVHRDIKPENLVITEVTGFDSQLRILDFGVAKLQGSTAQLTAGFAIGTPSYMAPEQSSGEAIDARTDLYATGILLFELLTGQKPFQAEQPLAILLMHSETPPPPLGARFSPALGAVVRRALAKAPRDRFQTAAEMASALDATPEAARPASDPGPVARQAATTVALSPTGPRAPEPAREPARRKVIIVAAAIVCAAAVVLVLLWPRHRATTDPPAAVPLAVTRDAGPPPAVAAPPPSSPGLPELPAIERLADSDPFVATAKLKKLRLEHPDEPYLPYLLGKIYCSRQMWPDCLDAFRGALGRYRGDPVLIRSAIRSFNSDRYYTRGMDFVEHEIGRAALPELQAVAADPASKPIIRTRAAELAKRLAAAPR